MIAAIKVTELVFIEVAKQQQGSPYDFNIEPVAFVFQIVQGLPIALRTQFTYVAMAHKAFPVCPFLLPV